MYGDALDRRFSFASLPFLGEAVAQIVLSPGFGPGEWHTVVEQEFTGREVVAAFEAVNGSKPQIKVFTDADVDEKRKQGPVWGLGASWRVHWGRGLWKVVNLFEPRGVERRTLEQAVREAKGGADSEKPAEQPKAPAAVSSGRSRLSGDDGGLTGHVAKHSGDDIGHAVKQPVRVK